MALPQAKVQRTATSTTLITSTQNLCLTSAKTHINPAKKAIAKTMGKKRKTMCLTMVKLKWSQTSRPKFGLTRFFCFG